MNPMFAAGLFDSPWIVAIIIVIGAFVNWLSQLRQQKQQRDAERQAREAESGSPQKPQGEFDLEDTLRRWLREEVPKPTPTLPPVIPRRAPSAPPPPVWQGKPPPVMARPPVAVTLPGGQMFELNEAERQASARLTQASEQVRHHHVSVHRVRRGRWSGLWHDRPSARRAFVGSLVFGPPKGLES